MERIFSAWASSETPRSACLSVETLAYPTAFTTVMFVHVGAADRCVISIPAGATVGLLPSEATVGLCGVSWDGAVVPAFREDILASSYPAGTLGHFTPEA